MKRILPIVFFALVLVMTLLIPLGATGDDGRPDGTVTPTAPVAGDDGTIDETGEWDGDGPAPRPFITTNANNSIGGSLCVGFDCIANEAFGFDTIRIRENNLRIHANDSSSAANFPANDWRILFNDSNNGGRSYFGIDDATAGRRVFEVSAGARTNALTVDSQGDVGIGLRNAAVDVHVRTGNTPTYRMDQDGSSGFTAQTWDVAGNEAGFFIRDVTAGSTLPLRIRPGVPTEALDIATTGIKVKEPVTGNAFITLNESAHDYSFRVNDSGTFAFTDDSVSASPFIIFNDAPQSSFAIQSSGAVTVFKSATAPPAVEAGLYYDTTTDDMCWSNGTSWFQMDGGGACS